MYYSGRGRNQDYISVLKKKAALSSGYANLFYGMCKIAGLEALVIRGYSKGFGYRGAIGKNPDHDWNAVKLSGKWYLVDAAWDAGYVEGSAFIKRYTTAWLYAGSRDFLYSHLPEKEQNQFYAPPLDAEIFQKEPYIPGAFFQYGLELKTPEKLAYETIAGEVLSIDINAGSMNTLLDAALRGTDFREIEGAAWQERNNAAYRFFFDVPGQGEYRAVVLARNKNEKRIQERIGIAGFERTILPGLARLVEENKITPAEADYYRASYVKVPENNLYYYQEDQFNLPANNAILKIQELLHISSSPPDTALDLNIRAAPAYAGYQSPAAHGGEKVRRFPRALPALREAIATRIISPLDGTLETGAEIKFSLSSRDYSRFSLSCGEESIPFTRTNPTSPFELTWIIPQGAKELSITASKDGKIYAGLVRYDAGKNDEP
jgi:hypothetical protein